MGFAPYHLQVRLSPDGFYPRALYWQGRHVRVLYVEEVYTRGRERRYRLRTPEGPYEVGFAADVGRWLLHRAPSLLRRWWAGIRMMPRLPAPAGRRRGLRRALSPCAADRRPGYCLASVTAAEGR